MASWVTEGSEGGGWRRKYIDQLGFQGLSCCQCIQRGLLLFLLGN
jgi:hypothetical protein